MNEIRHYLHIARKWCWLVVASTLVAAGVGFGISSMLPPVYRASTSLLVRVGGSTDDYAIILASERLAATYTELLTKRPVIEAAAHTLGLDPRKTEKRVQVRLVPQTLIIELTVEDSDPRLAMEIANGIVAAFMQISRESGSVRVRDLVVVEPATRPMKPVSPQRMRISLVAAMLGFLLVTGVALVVEYLDDTVETVEDVHQDLSLPTLTVVPCPNGRRKRSETPIVVADPASPLNEAYRTLRARIQFSRMNHTLLTLLISSPLSRAEQADVVTNLGVVMAQAGLKVLLVDADLRQPQLHRAFGLAQEPGLSTLLAANTGNWQECIAETGIPNLRLLPSGSPPPDPLGFLSSPQVAGLMEELKKHADIVMFNTPPILTAADALVLALRVDGTILVIESRSTRREAARRALEMLRNAGVQVLGVVLNRVRARPSAYYCYSDFSNPESISQASSHYPVVHPGQR